MPTGAGLSLAVIKDNVLQQTGTAVIDFASVLDATGDVNLTLICNKSWWEVMDRFDFREKETFHDFSTVDGTPSYDVATAVSPIVFDALRTLSIKDNTTDQYTVLIEISLDRYNGLFNSSTNQEAQPTNFLRDSGLIYLWPTPDTVYSLRLYFLQVLADIASGGPSVPQSWHEIIELGAVYRGYLALRDYNSAQQIRAHQLAMINSIATNLAKEDNYKPMIGVSVPTREFGRRY